MSKIKSWGIIFVVVISVILGTGIVFADLPDPVVIDVVPDTIRLNGEGEWVTVHTNIDFGEMDCATLVLIMEWLDGEVVKDGSVTSDSCCKDNHGDLVVKFDRADITEIGAVGDVTVTLTDKETFEATDTIRVIDHGN